MSEKYTAAFYEAFGEEQVFLKRFLPPDHKYYFTWKTIQEDGEKAEPPSKIISIRTQSKIPKEWFSQLDAVITRSTGYDHISVLLKDKSAKFATAYLPNYAARAVAEHALMLWIGLLRKLNQQMVAFRNFHRDGLTGAEMKDRKITIIGVGRIGSQILDIAYGLSMNYRGVDIVERKELVEKYNLTYLSLEEGIKFGEIIVSALPLTELTRAMLNYKVLSKAPRGAIFVNVGRGEVSPLQDLLQLVNEGTLSGVGLDVYNCEAEIAAVLRDKVPIESLPRNSQDEARALLQMIDHPSFILTPHNAFNTVESVERKSQNTAENLKSFLETGRFITPIPVD